MRFTAGVLALALAVVPAAGQESKKKAPPEPKTWMTKKGALLWHETFEGEALSKDWHKGQGDWKVAEGALKGAEQPADKHHAYVSRKVSQPNAVIQFSFKLEGAGWLGAFFDGKEHVAALQLSPDQFRIARMSGIGPTTKRTDLDTSKTKLDDGAWHTVVWEFQGDEMVATIDDKEMALGKAEGLSMERLHLELNTGGVGATARFKDVKIWAAEPDPKWAQKRATLIPMLKKKATALGYK
jgi:hypothetical protein